MFFTIYAKSDGVWLAPAWLEGREAIAVFEDRADPKPNHFTWLEWPEGLISFIRDYRYLRYIAVDGELVLVPESAAGWAPQSWPAPSSSCLPVQSLDSVQMGRRIRSKPHAV